MAKVISDHTIDVGKLKSWETSRDGFGFRPVVEMLDYDVEHDLRFAHSDDAKLVDTEGRGLGFDCKRHGVFPFSVMWNIVHYSRRPSQSARRRALVRSCFT